MKGIYLTTEGKKEIEAKIAELKDYNFATQDIHLEGNINGHLYCLNEILSSATILPVEDDWDKTVPNGIEEDTIFDYIQDKYPNGVIIKPKE